MRAVYRGLASFATRTALLAALLVPLSYAAHPRTPGARPAPQVRLSFDPLWAQEVDRMIDRNDYDGLWCQDARSMPVLIDRLLHDGRGQSAARFLERLLESRNVTDEGGEPIRVAPRSPAHHDLLARWYLENRELIESRW